MKIAILGSTGFVGKVLLERALDDGYTVKTLVRNPQKLGDLRERVELIHGNISDTNDVEETVAGTEAVLSTVGPPLRHPDDPRLYEKAMRDLVGILERHNIRRFIHIGGAVHLGGENENWSVGRRYLRLILLLACKPVLMAKHLEWEILKQSNLDWTLVRPPRVIQGKSKGRVLADDKNLARTRIDVEDLVRFMLEQIESEAWIKRAPLVASPK